MPRSPAQDHHPPRGRGPAHPPEPVWVDTGKGRRALWGCGAIFPIACLLIALSAAVSGLNAADNEPFVTAIVFLLFGLGLSIPLTRGLPRVLAEQGISVDTPGVALVQRPKWWFKGRVLLLPWHEIQAVTSRTGAGAVGDTPAALGPMSFHLRHAPPEDLVPTWMNQVPPGTTQNAAAPVSAFPQLVFTPDQAQRSALADALRAHRPGVVTDQVPADPSLPGGGPARPPVPGAPPGPPGPPSVAVEGSVSMRGPRIAAWIRQLVVCSFMAYVFGMILYVLLADGGMGGELDAGQVLPFTPLLIIGTAGLVGLWALLVLIPQYWTRQGIKVDRFGISVAKEPMWWFRGHHAHVPWHDVRHISLGSRGSGKTRRVLVEVNLHHIDHELRLPGWAALAMGGESKWGRISPHPALLLDLRSAMAGDRFVSLLRSARGDLFEDTSPARNQPRGAPQGAAPGQYQYAGTQHRVPVAPQWKSLRARRGWTWALGLLVSLYVLVFTVAAGLLEVERNLERQEYGNFFPPIFWTVVFGLLLVWSVRSAPRCLTHQGVSLDENGITLVQDPMLWFEGRTVFLPWHAVYLVRPEHISSGKSSTKVIKIFMNQPNLVTHVPTWCRLSPQEDGDAPATAHQPLTRVTIRPGSGPQAALAQAFSSARPDLMPSL